MTQAEAIQRHHQLVEEINRHDFLYYVEAKPVVSDFDYDHLYQELLDLESRFPELASSQSPSQRVGGKALDGFTRVIHQEPMLSLEKIKAVTFPTSDDQPDVRLRKIEQDQNTVRAIGEFDATIRKQLGRDAIDYTLEPKVDGVSITVHYRNGKLVLGATRGDGHAGDDITANIRTIRAIPLELKTKTPPALIEIRGEAYISTQDFEKLNQRQVQSGEEPFPNARNATAGTLKQLDPKIAAQRPLSAVFYAVGLREGIEFQTQVQALEQVKAWGLPIQAFWRCCQGAQELLDCYRKEVVCDYDETRDLRTRVPYDIDGIVIKVNDLDDWKRLPPKAKAPGYAIVHKPIPWITPAETVLRDITVQVGRTGVLTPVAELEPVFVQGSTISRATLHNEDEIRRKDIRIGDTVVIRKAGMVIPEVVEVVKAKRNELAKPFDLAAHVNNKCPACGGAIAREELGADGGKEVAWRCQNVAGCPAQKTRRIEYFAQRKALDIESLGGIVAEKLVERGLANEPMDLFNLTLDPLGKLNLGTDDQPRVFGEKNAAKIIEALQRAKTLPLQRWIYALAIPEVGDATAYQLAATHETVDSLAASAILNNIADEGEKAAEGKKLRKELKELKTRSSESPSAERQAQIQTRLDALKIELKALEQAIIQFSEIKQMKEVGPVAARSVLEFLNSEPGIRLRQRMKELDIHPQSPRAPGTPAGVSEGILSGKTIVLTGTLANLSRDQAAELIRAHGGTPSNSVSSKTDFVVYGAEAGSKTRQSPRTRRENSRRNRVSGPAQSPAVRQKTARCPTGIVLTRRSGF